MQSITNIKELQAKEILFKNANVLHKVLISEIVRCQAASNYTIIHLSNGKTILLSKSLKEYEILFSGYSFFRIHQSHLINLLFVDMEKSQLTLAVILTNGLELPVSVRKRKLFKELLDKICV